MPKTLAAILALTLAAAGCAEVHPRQFQGPNGKVAFSMECSGMGRTLEDCYVKAGEICPHGYNIIDVAKSQVAMAMNGMMMLAPQYHLAIECK